MRGKFNIKVLFIFVFIILLVTCLNNTKVYGYEYSVSKSGIENFPESYKAKLNELKKAHPNWNFTAVYTNLDFNHVGLQETKEGVSLINAASFSDIWKRDNTEVEPGWVNASEYAVKYYLDPRNFLTEDKIFQFESTEFNDKAQNTAAIEAVLNGYGLYKKDYYIKDNSVIRMGMFYSDLLYLAGQAANVNPVHLASRVIQETGGTLASLDSNGNVVLDNSGRLLYWNGYQYVVANRLISGSFPGYNGYYNFFNIGSFCSSVCGYCGNPALHGAQKAKNSGWTTPQLAINAAGTYLRNNFIKYGQNTIYFERFDVNFVPGALYLFGGQYMTNISVGVTESALMYKGYKSTGNLENAFNFYIPVYDNMPSLDQDSDNVTKKVKVNVGDGYILYVRSGPGTNYQAISKLANGTVITQISSNENGWIKIRMDDGTQGYVYAEWVVDYEDVKDIEVTNISFAKTSYSIKVGETLTLDPIIEPENATDKSYTISSSNSNVVRVEDKKLIAVSQGNAVITYTTKNSKNVQVTIEVTKNDDQSNDSYTIDSNILTVGDENTLINISEKTALSNILSGIKLSGNASVICEDINLKALSNDEYVGTGTRVTINSSNGSNLGSYVVVIKGDVNGDGKISASDYVLIKNNIMGTKTLSDIQRKGADVNKDGKISAGDYVKIKNHIMGISSILN